MACDEWRSKLDAYADGELSAVDAAALSTHMRGCASCANDLLERVQMKRSVQMAGRQFTPSADLRNRIAKSIAPKTSAAKPSSKASWLWILALPALTIIILSVGLNLHVSQQTEHREHVFSELADLHVSALASASPVDVVSTDRHTVKPWFQGKIPFTFNLPELQGTNFSLIGGRVTYLEQTPGAHLIYQLRKHKISAFIFQDGGNEMASLSSGSSRAQSFSTENWTQNGLRYFVVGDVGAEDIQALSKLLRDVQ